MEKKNRENAFTKVAYWKSAFFNNAFCQYRQFCTASEIR